MASMTGSDFSDNMSQNRLEEGDICGRIVYEKNKYKNEILEFIRNTYFANPSEAILAQIIEGIKQI